MSPGRQDGRHRHIHWAMVASLRAQNLPGGPESWSWVSAVQNRPRRPRSGQSHELWRWTCSRSWNVQPILAGTRHLSPPSSEFHLDQESAAIKPVFNLDIQTIVLHNLVALQVPAITYLYLIRWSMNQKSVPIKPVLNLNIQMIVLSNLDTLKVPAVRYLSFIDQWE